MEAKFARLRLGPGRVAYFDPITRLHVTLTIPVDQVRYGAPIGEIVKALRHRVLFELTDLIDVKAGTWKPLEVPAPEGEAQVSPSVTETQAETEQETEMEQPPKGDAVEVPVTEAKTSKRKINGK